MDPLSITASVITVLQAANEIISFCYDYKAALHEQPWGLSRMLSQMRSARAVLEQIEAISSSYRFTNLVATTALGQSLADCAIELDHIQALLTPSKLVGKPRTHRYALLRALGWRLKEREAEQHLKNIERIQSTLSVHLNVRDTELLLDLKTSSGRISSEIQHLRRSTDEQNSSEQENRLHCWLSRTDVAADLSAIASQRAPDTGKWLLKHKCMEAWLHSRTRQLWLSGCSGAGKTVLCATIVQAALETQPTAYFFCNFRMKQQCTTIRILSSILSQLISTTKHLPHSIMLAFEEQSHAKMGPSLDSVITGLRSFPEACILLDAVDESEDPGGLTSLLVELPCRVFVSSRSHLIIADELTRFNQIRLADHEEDVCADIAKYITHQLCQNSRLCALSKSIRDHVAAVLVEKSAGMFRWTQCQLQTISASRNVKQIRAALQSLPLGLDETYNRILSEVPSQDADLVRRLLTWLAFSVIPLTALEAREALAICTDGQSIDEEELLTSVDDVLTLCSSLVSVSRTGHLALAHSSVRDFLLSDKVAAENGAYALSKEQAYLELATSCLTYLNFTDFGSGPALTADLYRERLERYVLARHVATAWPYYVRGCGMLTPVMAFFNRRGHFMSWVQILNADHGFKWNIYPAHATTLYYAASFGLRTVVEELMKARPELDAPGSRYGGTALHGAAFRGHEAIVSLLLEAGADPNKADWHQVVPLQSAIEREYGGVVGLLLDYGARTRMIDLTGETPMDRAGRIKNKAIIDMLEEADLAGRQPLSRTTTCSSATSEDNLELWRPSVPAFPYKGLYTKRSGLESSIVISVEFVGRMVC